MDPYKDRQDDFERYEFQMGGERGRLALSLDMLTDALVLVGQHGVYCQSARQPGRPAMDIQLITSQIAGAKQLVADVMERLRKSPETFRRAESPSTDNPGAAG